jgi:glycosyltransferase involved in cell wall biosynthesis
MGTTDRMAKTGLDMSVSIVVNPETNPEPLVSVLVPSYNHEKYVLECLESIKGLNYKRLELIISDDCSPDDTFNLAERWAERNTVRFERILVKRQETNLGIIRNLQFLFNSAHGEYLAYIASDDAFVPSAILSRVQVFQKYLDIDAVFGNAELISESGSVLKAQGITQRFARELSAPSLMVPSLILTSFVPGPVMMLRRAAIFEGGSLGPLPADLRAEDWYIYLRMAIGGRLRYVNEVVAKYRITQTSLSRSPSHYKTMIEALIHVDNIFRYSLTGFNRFLLETRIIRWKLELTEGKRIRKKIIQSLVSLQKMLLFVCALAHKGHLSIRTKLIR